MGPKGQVLIPKDIRDQLDVRRPRLVLDAASEVRVLAAATIKAEHNPAYAAAFAAASR